MQRFFLLFFGILSISVVDAQDCPYSVSGNIYDATTHEPLPFANVRVKGTEKGTAADAEGHFTLTGLCVTEFDLIFSYIGYKSLLHHHDTHHPLPMIFLAQDNITLESVVIEAKREEESLKTTTLEEISGRTLEENGSGNLASALGSVTGVSILSSGQNVAKPIVHGLHSNRVLVVNNGVRHEFQNWGAEHGPEVDPTLADRIRVVKGAATVRYGPDALGGVILIDGPEMKLHESFKGEAGTTFNTNGRSAGGDLTLHKGYDRMAFMAQGSYVIQGDLRAPDYLLTNTGKRENSVAIGGRYHLPKIDLQVYYSRFGQELGVLRGSVNGNLEDLATAIESDEPVIIKPFTYEIQTPRQKVAHQLFKLEGELHGDKQSLSFRYALQNNHRQEFDVRRGTLNELPSIDLSLITHSLDINYQHPDWKGWEGEAGFQWTYQNNDNNPGTNTVHFLPNYNITRAGIYLVERKKIGLNIWEAGLRYDYEYFNVRGRKQDNSIYRNELNFQNISGTIGVNRNISKDLLFKSNLGSAWRAPNIYELYVFGKHESSLEYGMWRYQINEDQGVDTDVLLDEKEKKVYSEVGVKWINTLQWNNSKWNSEITGYINVIRHFIYSTPAGTTITTRGALPFFIYDQTDALITGVDVSMEYTHRQGITSTFRLSCLYGRDIRNHSYFVEMPPLRLDYDFRCGLKKFFLPDAAIFVKTSYQFAQWNTPPIITVREILDAANTDEHIFTPGETFDFTQAPDGFFKMDIGMSAGGKHFHYLVQINNLLNKSYRLYTDRFRYFADETGINLRVSVSYHF